MNEESSIRNELKILDVKRISLEAESQVIVDELTQTPLEGGQAMGLHTPLVDADGYPRSDIDVYRARQLRKRLAEIRTDHKEVMKQIEIGLTNLTQFKKHDLADDMTAELQARLAPKPKPKYDPLTQKWVVKNWDGSIAGVTNGHLRQFDHLTDTNVSPTNSVITIDFENDKSSDLIPNSETLTEMNLSELTEIPFAVIDDVSPHSPAEESGLQEGDLIISFGPVNYHNHRSLSAIAEIVPEAAANQKEITVIVLRRRRMSADHDVAHSVEAGVRVKITRNILPRPWSGRGLLGCHIKAYNDSIDYEEP